MDDEILKQFHDSSTLFDMEEIKTLDPAIRRVIGGMFAEFSDICFALSDLYHRLEELEMKLKEKC